jgi:thiamine biosynthesis lipoprotein
MPVSYWRSVTVLAPLTSAAGATTTIAMLLQEQGLNYLQNSGFAFLAVDHAGEVFKGDQTS